MGDMRYIEHTVYIQGIRDILSGCRVHLGDKAYIEGTRDTLRGYVIF